MVSDFDCVSGPMNSGKSGGHEPDIQYLIHRARRILIRLGNAEQFNILLARVKECLVVNGNLLSWRYRIDLAGITEDFTAIVILAWWLRDSHKAKEYVQQFQALRKLGYLKIIFEHISQNVPT